jgi:hypothetical protein
MFSKFLQAAKESASQVVEATSSALKEVRDSLNAK